MCQENCCSALAPLWGIKYLCSIVMFYFLLSLLLSCPILLLSMHLHPFSFMFPRKKALSRQCDLLWEYLTQMR